MSQLSQISISEAEFEHLDQYFFLLTLSPSKLLERLEKSLKSSCILFIPVCINPGLGYVLCAQKNQ